MFKHNLLITFRNIKKFKSTFLINLIGLSTGLACVLLIYLWINDELSVDKFHTKDARLYQVMANHNNTNGVVTMENTPDLLADALVNEMSEVEKAVPVLSMKVIGKSVISVQDKNIKAEGQFAGKDYFKIFSYKLLHGSNEQVLSDKKSIVISKQLALKLFNTTENILGKSLEWQLIGINEPFIVSGVFDLTSVNSSAQYDFILPFEAWLDISKKIGRPVVWGNNAPSTYLVLKEGSNIDLFNKKIAGFIKSKVENSNITLFTRKYSDSYLYGKYENGKQTGGRIEYVRIFSIMAIFILIIACINFMNLATAKAGSRLKEVGVKKSVGASRSNLIFQFIIESTTISILSLISAVIIVELLLSRFNEITGKDIALSLSSGLIPVFILIALLTGLLTGIYPALYISRYNPANILKRKASKSGIEIIARKGLVIFQFVVSIILITSVLVISRQVNYIQSRNPGYEKDNLIYLEKEGKAMANQDIFVTEIKKIPGVANASIIGSTMVGTQSNTGGLYWEGKNPDEVVYFEEISVGYDMLETLGINFKEGRSFSKDFGDEKSKIIFNEAAIKAMGLKYPIGKNVRHYSGDKEIIGVVKDFNFESMHEVVKPALFRLLPEQTTKFMSVRGWTPTRRASPPRQRPSASSAFPSGSASHSWSMAS
jgi:ABC-type antimicrobial peptide transport system permease subunit